MMNAKIRSIGMIAVAAALGLVLVALPGASQSRQDREERAATAQAQSWARLAQELAELQAPRALLAQESGGWVLQNPDNDALELEDLLDDVAEGGIGWLGVETRDVNAEKAKELKLPGERGVLLTAVVPDSPAAKAGLKENDVVTEINGQRVEGALQFRRMIHEIPAGRTVQIGIIRDGATQTISVTLGKSEGRGMTIFR